MRPEVFRQRLLATLIQRKMLPDSSPEAALKLGVAVSGGADSVCLLRALDILARERGWQLFVLHVNHKLRGPESDEDAEFVSRLAAGLRWTFASAELPLLRENNLEAEARALRYEWFRHCVADLQLDRIAFGHTASDQSETVLYRLLRGSGPDGLSGVRFTTEDGFVRPLLEFTRAEVRSQLQPGEWREDASNQDLTFDRNRIRHELLPYLAELWNPRIEEVLAGLADRAQAEEAYWGPVIRDCADRILCTTVHKDAQLCPTEALNSQPVALARRLIRYALQQVRGDLLNVEFAHVEQIRALAAQPDGSGRLQLPGVDVMRSFDWLRFAAPGSYGGDRRFSTAVPVPGEAALPESDSLLILREEPGDCRYTKVVDCLDGDRVPGSLELRTWQPGDRFCPAGHSSEVKLKFLFQEARVPLWDRRTWPVLAAGPEIVWTRKFGVAAAFAAGPTTDRPISVTEQPALLPGGNNRNQDPSVSRLLE